MASEMTLINFPHPLCPKISLILMSKVFGHLLKRNVTQFYSLKSYLHQPWINKSIKRLTRRKQHLYNKACHSGSETQWITYKEFKRYTQQ